MFEMKRFAKVVSAFMAVVLAVGLMPPQAFAAGGDALAAIPASLSAQNVAAPIREVDVSTFGYDELVIGEGSRVRLECSAATSAVTWTSANSSVVEVDETGVARGVRIGYAKVYANAADGTHQGFIGVHVIDTEKDGISVRIGKRVSVPSSLEPLVWSSKNESIAVVDGAEVIGVSSGKAVITATGASGLTYTCEVSVVGTSIDADFALDTGNATISFEWSPLSLVNPGPVSRNASFFDRGTAIAGLVLSGQAEQGPSAAAAAFLQLGLADRDMDVHEHDYRGGGVGNSIACVEYESGGTTYKIVTVDIQGTRPQNNLFTVDAFTFGFETAASGILGNMKSDVGIADVADPQYRYFITGHSLGGAVTSILAKKLLDAGCSREQVTAYAFAPPCTCGLTGGSDGCENIKNIINTRDTVPRLQNPGTFDWRRNGSDFHFSSATEENKSAYYDLMGHAMPFSPFNLMGVYLEEHWVYTYMSYLLANAGSYEVTKARVGNDRFVAVHCPVSVDVLDPNGSVVLSAPDGVQGSGKTEGGIQVLSDGDSKYVLLPEGCEDYTIRLTGTGDGEMSCEVQQSRAGDVVLAEPTFYEGIVLSPEKQFVVESDPDSESSAANAVIYVLDEDSDAKAALVSTDGTEKPLSELQEGGETASGTWGTCPWEIASDGTLTVHTGTGADTGGTSPWSEWGTSIKRIRIDGSVVAPSDCSRLFSVASADDPVFSISVEGLDTSGTTDMSHMFARCSGVESLDLSPLDTSRVTSMEGMFELCWSLKSVDLSSFDTSRVTNMALMFMNCAWNLGSLDLSSFDTSHVTSMGGMFALCPHLQTVYVSDRWSTAATTSSDDMFSEDSALVGGNGTVFSNDHVDATYARIDAPGSPGYLTAKTGAAKKSLSGAAISAIPDQTYTGSAIRPAVEVSLGGKVLVGGADYTVSYANNTSVGTATVTVTGAGGYEGSVSATFKIVGAGGEKPDGKDDAGSDEKPAGQPAGKDLSGALVSLSPGALTYDGTAKRPAVTVALGGKALAAGRDYVVSYSSNVDAGTAHAVVTGAGAYTGSASVAFKISPASMLDARVSAIEAVRYAGVPATPEPAVTWHGKALAKGADYELRYSGNGAPGVARAVVSGKGNFAGATYRNFYILKGANPMAAKAKSKSVKVKAAKLAKKPQKLKKSKLYKIAGAQGKVTFAKKSGNKRIKVNKKTGKVTLKKGLKKGTYKVKVWVTAAGNRYYDPVTQTVTLKFKVG